MAATEPHPDGSGDPSRLHRWLAGVAVVVFGGLHLWGRRRPDWLPGDEAYYVGLARALAEGDGYVFDSVPHGIYPPGYPLALTPVVAVSGIDPFALQMATLLMGWVGIGAVAFYLVRRGDLWAAAPMVVVMASSVSVFDQYTDLRSEGLFLLVVMLALAAGERFVRSGPVGSAAGIARGSPTRWVSNGQGWIFAAGAGVLVGASVPAVRSVGIALPAAALATLLVVTLVRRGPPDPAGRGFLMGILGGGAIYHLWWWGRSASDGAERSYGNLLTMVDPHHPDLGRAGPIDVVARTFEQFSVQVANLVELMTNLPSIHPFFGGLPHLVLIAVVGRGVWEEARRPNPLAAWFFLAYLGIVVLWPFDEGTRFLMPLLPLIALFGYRGFVDLARRRPQTARGWRAVALIAACAGLVQATELAIRGSSHLQGLLWIAGWAGAALAALRFGGRRPRASWRPDAPRWVWAGIAVYVAVGVPTLLDRATRFRAGEQKFPATQIAEAIPWILDNTDPSTVLAATTEPQGLFVHTGRTAHRLPTTGNAERLWSAVDEAGARVLVVPKAHEYPYLLPTGDARFDAMDRAQPGRLTLAHEYSMGRIFTVDPPGPARSTPSTSF